MRAFVGCPLSEQARAAIGAWLDACLPPGWRPVPLASLHLTFGFFGDQAEELLALLAHRLRTAILPAVCRANGGRVRPFPDRAAPLLALELDATADLQALHDRMATLSASVGLPRDVRPFRPHITLARGRGDALDTICGIELEFRELCIYHSIPQPGGGRRYLARECVRLSDRDR